jgi:hypothetical protein
MVDMLSDADLVWNRACFGKLDACAFRGDRALTALLLFHGLAMNGGVLHAVECLQPRELAAAKSGYRYFGFHDVAELISDIGSAGTVAGISDLQEASFGRRYSKSVPDDGALSDRFEDHFKTNRSDFAPLSDADRCAQLSP